MKICFISPKAYGLFFPMSKASYGGAEVQMYLLSTSLAAKSHTSVSCIVASPKMHQQETTLVNGVNVYSTLAFDQPKLLQFLVLINTIFLINADVYIQRTLTPVTWVLALCCRLLGKKFIYMVAHDNEASMSLSTPKVAYSTLLMYLNFFFANKIIVQNEHQLTKLSRFGHKIELLPQSIQSNKKKKMALSNRKHVLWVGRSVSWKQPKIYLSLAKQFPSEKFIIVCPPSTKEPQLSDTIKSESRAIKNLRFIDFVSHRDIDELFEKSKVFISTSVQEGFPNTFLQAGTHGVPVISLNVDPNRMLSRSGCGYVCNGDVNKMANYLKLLLNNQKKHATMAATIRKYVLKNHLLEKNSELLFHIINSNDKS